MKKLLSEICEVSTGHHFRERLDRDANGNVSVIQMKDVADGALGPHADFARVQLGTVNERTLIKKGDVVLRSRGGTYTAAVAEAKLDRTIAAAPLLLIRLTDTRVSPEYLRWYLNQPQSQHALSSLASGSHVPTVSRTSLEALEVPIPSMERQRRIVEMAVLEAEETRLSEMINERRRKLVSGILMRYARNTR